MEAFQEDKHPHMLSQKAQDFWVNNVLGRKRDGYFLDLAAADGLEHSNTYFFETELNWKGLLIEPNPTFFAELEKNRSSQRINEVVSDRKHLIDFRYDNGQLGGIVADDTDNSKLIRGEQLKTGHIEQRLAKDLNEVLADAQAPNYIDYFSLDVEGAEERVISTLDFNTYRFGVLTIERANARVNEILLANNYKFIRNCRFDTFYMHEDVLNASSVVPEPFEVVPDKDW